MFKTKKVYFNNNPIPLITSRSIWKNKRLIEAFQITKLILVRLGLIVICLLEMIFAICVTENYYGNDRYYYLLFLIPILVIIIESTYICIVRRGKDFSWFSITALAYIVCLISIMWSGNDYKFKIENDECHNENISNWERAKFRYCVGREFTMCEIISLTSCIFLIPLIFLRWVTPHSRKLSRSAHSQLVILLLSSAADIVDFVEIINSKIITDDLLGVDSIMALTAVSSLLFCFTLTETRTLKRPATNLFRYWLDFIFCTECWAVVLSTVLLDIPYLIIRSIVIHDTGFFVQSTLAFFFLKNIFMILASSYRLLSLYKEYKEDLQKLTNKKLNGHDKHLFNGLQHRMNNNSAMLPTFHDLNPQLKKDRVLNSSQDITDQTIQRYHF